MIKRTIYFVLVLVFALSAFSFYLSNRNRVNAENAAIDITAPKYCVDVINEISDTAISEIDTFNLKIEDYINLNESFIIYDFFDYPTAIFYKRLPDGYAIYDYNTNTVLEYSDGDHPFFTDKSQTYYYYGVFNYYIKTKDGFLNLATGSITSADIKHFSFPDDITEVQMDGFPWPGTISYTSSDKIEKIMGRLESLDLCKPTSKTPDEEDYFGGTWAYLITSANYGTIHIEQVVNRFVRTTGGDWWEISPEQAYYIESAIRDNEPDIVAIPSSFDTWKSNFDLRSELIK